MGGERKREENLCDGRRGNCVRWERERCNNIRKGRVTTILCQGGERERGTGTNLREKGGERRTNTDKQIKGIKKSKRTCMQANANR